MLMNVRLHSCESWNRRSQHGRPECEQAGSDVTAAKCQPTAAFYTVADTAELVLWKAAHVRHLLTKGICTYGFSLLLFI